MKTHLLQRVQIEGETCWGHVPPLRDNHSAVTFTQPPTWTYDIVVRTTGLVPEQIIEHKGRRFQILEIISESAEDHEIKVKCVRLA
jgi:hypothetical protein